MIGCYDFCGHYEWTFGWLERVGGHAPVGSVAGQKDVRLRPDWPRDPAKLDRYSKANDPDAKLGTAPQA